MTEVHYIISSFSLIPEVELFSSIEKAREYWNNAFSDTDVDDEGNNPEESFSKGYARFDEYELRYGFEVMAND